MAQSDPPPAHRSPRHSEIACADAAVADECEHDAGQRVERFAGDLVSERFSQADMLGFLVQIGAVPAPA